MPIYHCYAKTPYIEVDGLVVVQKPIADADDYDQLKKHLAEGVELDSEEGLVICSLTLLQA